MSFLVKGYGVWILMVLVTTSLFVAPIDLGSFSLIKLRWFHFVVITLLARLWPLSMCFLKLPNHCCSIHLGHLNEVLVCPLSFYPFSSRQHHPQLLWLPIQNLTLIPIEMPLCSYIMLPWPHVLHTFSHLIFNNIRIPQHIRLALNLSAVFRLDSLLMLDLLKWTMTHFNADPPTRASSPSQETTFNGCLKMTQSCLQDNTKLYQMEMRGNMWCCLGTTLGLH